MAPWQPVPLLGKEDTLGNPGTKLLEIQLKPANVLGVGNLVEELTVREYGTKLFKGRVLLDRLSVSAGFQYGAVSTKYFMCGIIFFNHALGHKTSVMHPLPNKCQQNLYSLPQHGLFCV